MNEIRNIIFDLGVVILNIDFKAAEREFRKMGINDFEAAYSKAGQIGLFDRFEEGRISPEGFRNELRDLFGVRITDEEVDKCWNAMLLDFPAARIDYLKSLKNKYRLFLLSNTNAIHYITFTKNFWDKFGYEFEELFEKMYLSFQVGLRKPDIKIFKLILENHKLNPEETLYIDDTAIHLASAEKAGITSHLLKEGEDIYDSGIRI